MEDDVQLSPATETPTPAPHEARIAALERELSESRESERYWSGLAKSSTRTPTAEPEPEPDEDGSEFVDDSITDPTIEGDTPEKLIDEFAAEGVKALAKRGFITAKDAQKIAADTALRVTNAMIGRERAKMSTDQQILGEFPDLKDQNSALFKETAKRYQKAIAMDPAAKKTPAALYLAAEGAKEALARNTRRDDDDDFEPEPDRRQRAASQDGRTRTRPPAEADDDMMGSEARQIAKMMGISDKEFLDARKETAIRPIRRAR